MKVLLLFLLPALAFADSAALRKSVVDQREQWVGKKRDFVKFPVLDADGKAVFGKEGDFASEFIENAFNPVAGAKLDKAKLVEGFKKCQSWAAGQRKAADALLKAMDALVTEAEGGKPLSLSADGDDELSVAARGAGTADGLAEYLGVLRRWRSLDQWRSMTLQWLEEDGKRGLAYLDAHPDLPGNSTSAIFVSGGEHIVRAKLEIQSLQRLAEDLLKSDAAEKTASKKSPHGIPPSLRDAWDRLATETADKDVTALLEQGLENRWHNATIAHQLWKYDSAKAIPQIAKSIKAWKALGGADIVGLLEVFHARQGTVFGDFSAADRFMEKVATFESSGERDAVFKRAQQQVGQWYSGMSYKHSLTLAKVFETRQADCFNCGNMVAALMGNQGFDGLYPIMESFDGDSHLQTACKIGDRYIGGDGMGMGAGDFPKGYAGSGGIRLVVLWFRTVDGWVDAQILDVGKGELTKRVVPYYGQAEEKTEAVK